MPSSNISVINEVMEVGKLALEIDTLDEESGVKSVDVFYQISASNGESLRFCSMFFKLQSMNNNVWTNNPLSIVFIV